MKKQPQWINTEQWAYQSCESQLNYFIHLCGVLSWPTFIHLILFMGKYATLYGLLQYLLIKHRIPLRDKRFIELQLTSCGRWRSCRKLLWRGYMLHWRQHHARAHACYKFNYSVWKSILEWLSSHKFCTGMTVPMLLFCLPHWSSYFRTIQWMILKSGQLICTAAIMARSYVVQQRSGCTFRSIHTHVHLDAHTHTHTHTHTRYVSQLKRWY